MLDTEDVLIDADGQLDGFRSSCKPTSGQARREFLGYASRGGDTQPSCEPMSKMNKWEKVI